MAEFEQNVASSSSEPTTKRSRKEPAKPSLPSSVFVSFRSKDSSEIGAPVNIPIEATVKQLEMVINSLLNQEDNLPYSFYINDYEVTDNMKETIEHLMETRKDAKQFSLEETIAIHYHPLSVYRVRPVTRCSESMPGHTDAVIHVSYSPDGKKLASGGGDMTVRFWNVTTSTPTHTCVGHRHHVLCTAWSPNGQYFVSADRSGEIRIWDPVTGLAKGNSLRGHSKWVTALAFEPLHMDPASTRFASSSKDQTIKIWNVYTGLCETTISGHTDSVECVKWGGNGLLYTCSRDRTIKVWAIDGHGQSKQKLVRTLTGHAHRINTLALNCDYIIRTGAYELKVAKPGTDLSPAEAQQVALQRYQALIGPDGERLVSGSDDFTLFLWKPQEDKHAITRMTGHQNIINHIAFSPDARYVASASFDKKIKLWCGKTGRFLATYTGHVGAIYQVSWSPDSCYIASASKDSTIKVWNLKELKKAMYTLPGHEDEVYTIDWAPNGVSVASGSKDRTIKIWHH